MKIINRITNYLITIASLILISCEDVHEPIIYDFSLYAETLELQDGFYHFNLDSVGIVYGSLSRTKFVANTNNPNIQKVSFYSGSWQYKNQDVPMVNGASYTKESLAFTWASIPFDFVGDTIYIKAKYYDEYEWVNYEKTIGVIIE